MCLRANRPAYDSLPFSGFLFCAQISENRGIITAWFFTSPTRWATVQGKTKERWLELCERATVEQDTQKLMALIAEINQLLEEKEQRLKKMYEENSSA